MRVKSEVENTKEAAFQQALADLLHRAHDELQYQTEQKQSDLVDALKALIEVLETGEMNGIFRSAYETACCCDEAESLFDACAQGCVRCALWMLWQVGVAFSSFQKQTALLHAAYMGSVQCVELLVPFEAKRVDRTRRGAIEYTLCGFGSFLEKRECLRILLPWGDVPDYFREDPLIVAALVGDEAGLQLSLGCAAEPLNQGYTALIVAASLGHDSLVKILFKFQARMQTENGTTALMCAAASGAVECAALLATREARLRDAEGRTALMYASQAGRAYVVEILAKREARISDNLGRTALMHAAERNQPECCRLLCDLEAGMQSRDGDTAMKMAAWRGYTQCVLLLMEKEAGRVNRYGNTALESALYAGHEETASVLAPVEADKTPCCLELAARHGMQGCLESLLERKETHENIPDAVFWAVQKLQPAALEALLAAGSSDIPDVFPAAYRGDVKMLLKQKENWGETLFQTNALDFAVAGGQRRAVQLILRETEPQQIACDPAFASPQQRECLRLSLPVLIRDDKAANWLGECILASRHSSARLLYPYCVLADGSLLQNRIEWCRSQQQFARVLAKARYIGALYSSPQDLESRLNFIRGLNQALEENPLYTKQIQLLRVLLARHIKGKNRTQYQDFSLPQERHMFHKQARYEVAFNRALMLSARNAINLIAQDERRVPGGSENTNIMRKLIKCRALLYGMQRYLLSKLREALAG